MLNDKDRTIKKVAVFASGNGSNFQSLIDAEKSGRLAGKIVLLISDKPEAYAVQRAKIAGIPTFYFDPKQYQSKKDYETVLVDILQEFQVDLIVLAGYMRLIGNDLLEAFSNQIINLHPSLLPSFKGKGAIEQAFIYGVKFTGVTVHFVDAGMDTGPIILQQVVSIDKEDTLEELTQKIHEVEHETLLEAANIVLNGNYQIEDRKVII